MSEQATSPGLSNSEEGTVLQALESALPFAGRVKMKTHLALGKFTAQAAMCHELITEGLAYADKQHNARMRRLTGQIVYSAIQDHPELFQPEIILEEA